MICPLQYTFAQDAKDDGLAQLEAKVQQLIHWFFFRLLDGEKVSPKGLMDRWNEVWFEGKQPVEVFFTEVVDQHTQLGFRGVRWLETFLRSVEPATGRPLAIGTPFKIKLGSEVALTGVIPLVREVVEKGRRLVEIVDYRGMPAPKDRWDVETDVRLSLLSLAFRQMFGEREKRVRLVTLSTGAEHIFVYTRHHRQRLLATLKGLLPAIIRGEIWPRHGPHCRSCDYRQQCIDWRG